MGNTRKLGETFLAGLAAAAIAGCSSNAAPQAAPRARPTVEIRHEVDPSRARIWLLTRAGITVMDATAHQPLRGVLLPGWIWLGEPTGCLPDLALGPQGEAIVSSDVIPTLWRVDPETLEVSSHALVLDSRSDRDVGFSALEYSAQYDAYFAVDTFDGSLWRIDPQLQHARRVATAAPLQGCRAGTPVRRVLPPGYVFR